MTRVVALRSRRRETLFGAHFGALTAEHLRGLIDAGVQEAFDLDFKIALCGRGDSDRRALANAAGGVIVNGVEEDEQARSTAAPGVEVTDAEVGRIRQVVASLVVPLPVFDVLIAEDDAATEPAAPHPPAVLEARTGSARSRVGAAARYRRCGGGPAITEPAVPRRAASGTVPAHDPRDALPLPQETPMTKEHVLGPDIDLDVEVVRDKKGRRITEARAQRLAEEALAKAGVGRPSLTAPRSPVAEGQGQGARRAQAPARAGSEAPRREHLGADP